jgi:hypothetical protein
MDELHFDVGPRHYWMYEKRFRILMETFTRRRPRNWICRQIIRLSWWAIRKASVECEAYIGDVERAIFSGP